MSDYLSNLVTRNLGWTNSLQPRKRVLFEMPTEGTELRWSPPDHEPARQDDPNRILQGNREQGIGNSDGVWWGIEPTTNANHQWVEDSDPWVGRGNERATVLVPNQLTQLLPVARSLFPRPKVVERQEAGGFLLGKGLHLHETPSVFKDGACTMRGEGLRTIAPAFCPLPTGFQGRSLGYSLDVVNQDIQTQSSPTYGEPTENKSHPKAKKSLPLLATPQSYSDAEEQGERSRDTGVRLSSSDAAAVAFTDPTDNLRLTEQSGLTTNERQRPSQLLLNPRSQLTTTELPNFLESSFEINRLNEEKKNFPHTSPTSHTPSTERLRHPTKNCDEPKAREESQPESGPKTHKPLVRPITKLISPQETPETAPSIRVTIGRIEVQANQPPEPSLPSPEPFRPQLSLEAYLKLRQGRRY